MDMMKVKSIIEKNIHIFQEEIKSKCHIDCKMLHTEKSDFPIFHPANREFFEYKFYEGLLEWYIRDYLVTPILCELFIEKGTTVLMPNKEESAIHVRFRYSNEEFGDDYPFAFIIQGGDTNTAVNYSSTYFIDDELDELFEANNLDHVEIIDWSETDSIHSKKVAWCVSPENRSRVFYVTLQEFFNKYFSEELYTTIVEKIKAAVVDANKEIGFNTIPNLSLRYLSDFKAFVLNELSAFPLETTQYQEFDKKGEPSSNFYNLLPADDYIVITSKLNSDGLLSAFIGNEKFAKCFLTSEYLYQVFQKGNEQYFDYSSVATGYFKSVELLMKKIMDLALDCSGHTDLWIQRRSGCKEPIDKINYRYNPKTTGIQVRFKRENEAKFSTEMGPLIWFLHDRVDGWKISEKGTALVHKCLLNYNQGCRNEHLHKDVIDDIESIKIIRTNTFLCLSYLLGGCQLTDTPETDGSFLGIENNSYDRLYKKLNDIPRSVNYYYIQFSGREPIKAIRLYDQETPQYDNFGNIQSIINYVKVEDFHIEYYESFLANVSKENMLILSRKNVPEKIWWYNKYKGQVEINW